MNTLFLQSIYLFLPAYFANMFPVICARYKLLEFINIPVDRKLFGNHKTIRGFIVGVGIALVFGLIQYFLYKVSFFNNISMLNYSSLYIALVCSLLLGFGTLFGDLIKSFFKRRLRITPGDSWPVMDQIDYVLGALLFIYPFFRISYVHLAIILAFSVIAHPLVNLIAYKLKIKSVWW